MATQNFRVKNGLEVGIGATILIAQDTGNVGVGTDDPQGKLHISSGTSGDCELILESDTDNNAEDDNPRILFRQDGGNDWSAIGNRLNESTANNNALVLANSVGNYGGIIFQTNNDVTGYSAATERMRITSSGNVGIGTDDPSYGLELSGSRAWFKPNETGASATALSLGRLSDNNSPFYDVTTNDATGDSVTHRINRYTGTWRFNRSSPDGEQNGVVLSSHYQNGSYVGIYNTTGSAYRIHLHGEDDSYFLNDGNVGIGTDNPSDKLHVQGDIRVHDPSADSEIKFGTDTDTVKLYRSNGSFDLTLLQGHSSNDALYLGSAGSVYVSIDTNDNDNDTKAFIIQKNSIQSGTELARFTESGRLGIGTNNPGYELEVAGDIKLADTGTLWFSDSSGSVEKIQATTGELNLFADAEVRFYESDANTEKFSIDVNNARAFFEDDSDTYWYRPAADTHAWTTAGVERLRIKNNGSIGIGTNNPLASLHLRNNTPVIRFEEADASADNRNWNVGVNGEEFYWQAISDSGSGGGNLFKMTRVNQALNTFEGQKGGNTWFIVDNLDKRVGIGTTNPTTDLDVVGTIKGQQLNVSGITTFQDDVNLGDDDKIILGDGDDLQIYHESSTGDSVIRETGGGNLRLGGTNVEITTPAGSETCATFNTNGAVELYYDNSPKFETTGAGVTVTGIATAATFYAQGGTYAAAVDSVSDAALVLEGENSIYVAENGGDYIRNLIGRVSNDIIIGQQNTNFIGDIELKSGNTGSVKLHAGASSDNVKLQTASDGIQVAGIITAISGIVTYYGDGQYLDLTNSVALGGDTTGDYVESITGTANEVEVTGGSGEGSTPQIGLPNNVTIGQDLTVTRDLQVNRDLNVNGTITVGGTSATLFTQTLQVADADLILGIRTDANGNDVSTDTTANHGGIAIASTEGTPLVTLVNPGAGETLPSTYKKIMWFKSGSFTGLATDAWLSNYAIGIGSTQVPNGVRLAAGGVHISETDVEAKTFTSTQATGTAPISIASSTVVTNLNADFVDGLHAGSFIRSDANDTFTGLLAQQAGAYTDNVTYGGRSFTAGVRLRSTSLRGGILVSNENDFRSLDDHASFMVYDAYNTSSESYAFRASVGSTLADKYWVTTQGKAYFSGNVGIGTETADRPLHVYASGIARIKIETGGNTQNADVAYYNSDGLQGVIGYSDANDCLNIDARSTTGDVVFQRSGSERMRLTSSGSLGIGTTAPSQRLDVNGNARLRGALYDTNNAQGSLNQVLVSTGSGGVEWKAVTAAGAVNGVLVTDDSTNQAQYINFSTATGITTEVNVDTSDLVYNPSTVRLGIATNNPGSTLAVGGTITELYSGQYWNVVSQADIGSDPDQIPLNQYLGELAFLDDHHPNGLRRDGGGSDDVSVTSAGLVGIGTTNPSEELHVLGGVVISSDVDTLGSDYATLTVGERPALDGYASIELKSDSNSLSAKIDGTSAGLNIWSNKNSINGERFMVNGGSSTEFIALRPRAQDVLRAQHNGTNGRVGINTTSPEYTLDFGETSASTIRLVSENNGTAIRVGAGGGNNDVTLLRVDAPTSNPTGESDSISYGFSLKYMGSRVGNNNSLSIFSDNQTGTAVEAVTVLQDGKIGIGIDDPAVKLDIKPGYGTNYTGIFTAPYSYTPSTGEIRIGSDLGANASAGDYVGLRFSIVGNGSGNANAGIFAVREQAEGNGKTSLAFATRNWGANSNLTEKVRITADGNLGVGITNPSEKLDVVGTVKATDFNTTSDQNLKTNIQTIEDPLEKIVQIRGVNFEWKENNKPSAGVIAQEVEKVLPQLVNGEDTKSVNYNGLIGLLVEAVKAQQEEINELKRRIG